MLLQGISAAICTHACFYRQLKTWPAHPPGFSNFIITGLANGQSCIHTACLKPHRGASQPSLHPGRIERSDSVTSLGMLRAGAKGKIFEYLRGGSAESGGLCDAALRWCGRWHCLRIIK